MMFGFLKLLATIAVLLVPLSAAVGTRGSGVQQSPPTPESVLFEKFIAKNGPIGSWSSDSTLEYIEQLGFSDTVKARFYGVDGETLSQICEDCEELQSKYGITLRDAQVWRSVHALIKNFFQLNKLSAGSGAEDLDLWTIIKHNPTESRPFLIMLSRHPHLALGSLRYKYRQAIDEAMFGVDEAAVKSPWSVPVFAFFPGLIACRYVYYFFDTNPLLAALLIATYSISDLAFLIEIVMFCAGSYNKSLKSFGLRMISAVVGGLASFLVFAFPNPFRWLFGSSVITYLSFLLMALVSAHTLFAEAKEVAIALTYMRGDKKVVKEDKKRKVRAAMAKFEKAPDTVLQKSDPREVYNFDIYNPVGKGAFGEVFLGSTGKPPHDAVAIKKMIDRGETGASADRKRSDEKASQLLLAAALLVLGHVGANTNELLHVDRLTQTLQEDLNMQEKEVARNWTIESRTLYAVASLNHPSLLKFYSSHAYNGAFYIVSKQIVPKGLSGQPLAVRLSAVQSFFRGVEELHAAGIVHRDLKIDNVGVAKGDPSRAVILDFGTSQLPYSDDSKDQMMLTCDPRYATPEQQKLWRKFASLEAPSQALIAVTRGYQGPPSDVWAAALTAIEMVLFGVYGCASIDCIYYLAQRDYRHMLGQQLGKDRTPDVWMDRDPKVPSCFPDFVTTDVINMILSVVREHWKTLAGVGGAPVPSVDDFCALISSMLDLKRERRPTMSEAASDKFWVTNNIGDYADAPAVAAATPDTAAAAGARGPVGAASRPSVPVKLLSDMTAILVANGQVHSNPIARDEVCGPIISKLKRLFTVHAETKSGEIKSEEKMLQILRESGLQASLAMDDKRAGSLWQLLDWDENGSVSKVEFFAGLSILLLPMATEKTRSELLFHACDENDDAYISLEEMVNLLTVFGWTEGDATSHFLSLDEGKARRISKDKFLSGMAKVPLFAKVVPGTQRRTFGY